MTLDTTPTPLIYTYRPLPPLPLTHPRVSGQESASKPRHQRKHPLILPSGGPPAGGGGPGAGGGSAGRPTGAAPAEDVPDGAGLPRGTPPAKPPRLK